MLLSIIVSVIYLVIPCNGRVLLYNTENTMSSSEKFDCIYVVDIVDNEHGDSISGKMSYCRRPNITRNPTKVTNECKNGGHMKYFVDLLAENIRPLEVLQWNSCIDIAEKYAAFYYNNHSVTKTNEKQDFLCYCTNSSTFGTHCEYQLTHEANSFEESERLQSNIRHVDFNEHQRYGDIVCYNTLLCTLGPLCLDWRDICNGAQQCENGWDEENCDKLEFNECEEDEFRCNNGMCIPEEYWLDGHQDCMDWSDENFGDVIGYTCFAKTTIIGCDEHICPFNLWSCGDGQCILWQDRLVFQNILPRNADLGCKNLRNMNYMCELSTLVRAWTLQNGLCWIFKNRYNDPQLSMNNFALSDDLKCLYLIRCALSDGLELDCPCNRLNCSYLMPNICARNKYYGYPSAKLIHPYIRTLFGWTLGFKDEMPHLLLLSGGLRCRGYHGFLNSTTTMEVSQLLVSISNWDYLVCATDTIIRNISSSMKYDNDCWKNSLTFDGHPYAIYDVCTESKQCISQYRINDGWWDCVYAEDEIDVVNNKHLCTRVRRHRFQCSNEQPTCLSTPMFMTGQGHCSNNYDQYLYGYGRSVRDITCRKSDPASCQLFREYIVNSTLTSNLNTSSHLHVYQRRDQSTSRIPFRSYCDTWWDIPAHTDELPRYCQNWVCHRNQYRCQTGQCIPFDWVCDEQWDCVDGSDEEAIFAIHQWSLHNEQLKGLNGKRETCGQLYSNLPFSQFCDVEKEFPCLRSNFSNPLDLAQNRPCIPYSKIGDEIEDCHNAYDEKNALESSHGGMWGFTLRCGIKNLLYPYACHDSTNQCIDILCSNQYYQLENCSKPDDAVCIRDRRCVPSGRCNGIRDCLYGEDEYWCPRKQLNEQLIYRDDKRDVKQNHGFFDRQTYPSFQLSTRTFAILPQPPLSNFVRMIKALRNSHVKYSFKCNRGVTVLLSNKTVCFCPPAYFGHKCQFFSDRITIVTHLDLATWSSLSTMTSILSMPMPALFLIKVSFLFNEIIIDHYDFYSNPTVEMHTYVKHKFYLVYSRSTQMLSHKKARFYNRTDIEQNHPYSVHFDIYALHNNQSTPVPMGSWHYSIYFDFLPSFRLAKVLRFPNWLGNSTLDPCANHTCNQNSTCQPIFNQNSSYFCSCNNGFYGKYCSKYEDICSSYCAPYSLCRPDDRSMIAATNNPFCICPLGYFGPRCYLKFEQCNANPCLNNGSCVYTYESYGGDAFVCNCSNFFYGDRCQYAKVTIHVRLNASTTFESPRASTIQFYDVDSNTLQLILRHQQVSPGFLSSVYYAHDCTIAPVLGVLKTHYDLIQPKYFIIYLQPNTSSINISSSPEYCPPTSLLLDKNDFPDIPDVFKYHHICRNDSRRFCFYDKDYLCICQWDHYQVDCFLHDTQIDHCNKCLSNGKCVKGDTHKDNDFICLCSRCHQGHLCEFNMQAFGFTLDSLLVDYLKGTKTVYFSIVVLLFIVGLFNNLCSFVTFKRPTPRKVGVGNYLFIITCLNQMSLLCLLIKFIQITFEITNRQSCKTISYLFSAFTRLTYWLTSWVTIDRFLAIFFPTSVTLKKPRLAISMSVVSSFCLFGMHIHEFIYYTTIQHDSSGSTICVTNFDIHSIATYNRVSTIIHYLLPFCIQVIAITLLIVLAARSRTKTSGGNMSFRRVLIKQFRTQKELYITPIIIILSALPQTILTFTLACAELNVWHRHALLITYLLSYAPQILGFILYVLPSTTYRKEFSEALSSQQFSSWLIKTKHSTITISKKN